MKQKHIVILGAGFGGVSTALTLARKYPHFRVTVIDRCPHHVIHSNLYELAASPEEITDMMQLKKSVAISLTQIFKDTHVEVKQETVVRINIEQQTVEFTHGSLA